MHEDIIIFEDMSYDDILELSELILVPVQEIVQAYNIFIKENKL